MINDTFTVEGNGFGFFPHWSEAKAKFLVLQLLRILFGSTTPERQDILGGGVERYSCSV